MAKGGINILTGRIVESFNGKTGEVTVNLFTSIDYDEVDPCKVIFKDQDGLEIDSFRITADNVCNLPALSQDNKIRKINITQAELSEVSPQGIIDYLNVGLTISDTELILISVEDYADYLLTDVGKGTYNDSNPLVLDNLYEIWNESKHNQISSDSDQALTYGTDGLPYLSALLSGTPSTNRKLYYNIRHEGGLNFVVTAAWELNGSLFGQPVYVEYPFTLPNADPDFGRFSLVILEDDGTISVKNGDATATPAEPTLDDPSSQLKGSFIFVGAGETEPDGFDRTLIYDENVGIAGGEFDSEVTPVGNTRIVLDSTNQVFNGSNAIEITSALKYDAVEFTPPSPIEFSPGDNIQYKLLNKTGNYKNQPTHQVMIQGVGQDGFTLESVFLNLDPTYDNTDDQNWQVLSAQVPDGLPFTSINYIRWVVLANNNVTFGAYLDEIEIVKGTGVDNPPSGVTADYVRNEDEKYLQLAKNYADTVLGAPIYQIIDLGDILTDTIEDAFNDETLTLPIEIGITGFTVIKATQDGIEKEWLFVGTADTYNASTLAISSDFFGGNGGTGGGGNLINITSTSGFVSHQDDQYTVASPLSITADTDTILPNNKGISYELEKPLDLVELVNSSGQIVGKEGDAYVATIEYTVKPTNVNTTYIDTWIDIGGGVGQLYRRPHTFPKGVNIDRPITFSTGIYTLDTWEANGGTVYVRANGSADIHSIRFVIYRLHKAANQFIQNNSLTVDQLAAIINSSGASESNPFITKDEAVRSVSINGGTPVEPDETGNVDLQVNSGSSNPITSKTGTNIVFTEDSLYNEINPLPSGDLILDLTGAVKGVMSIVYCDRYIPQITGENYLISGIINELTLNELWFFWNGTFIDLMVINKEYLTRPENATTSASDTQVTLENFAVVNAESYEILFSTTDDINTANPVPGYNGTDLIYNHTGLTNGTVYYYWLRAKGNGYLDSDYFQVSETAGDTAFNKAALVGYYEHNETSGTTATDSHTSGNDGVLNNITLGNTGVQGNAYGFNGSSSFISYAGLNDKFSDDWTVLVWAKTTRSAYQRVFQNRGTGTPGTVKGFTISLNSGDFQSVLLDNGVGTFLTFGGSSSAYLDGNWHQFALSFNKATGRVRLYEDATKKSEVTEPDFVGVDFTGLDVLAGKSNQNSQYFLGDMDIVAVFQRELTEAEITEHYNNGNGKVY